MTIIETLALFVKWLFLTSLKATIVAALIIIVQTLLRNKLPAKWQYALWFLLIARLIIPFEMPSPVSVFNVLNKIESQTVGVQPFPQPEPETSPTMEVSTQAAAPKTFDITRVESETQVQIKLALWHYFSLMWLIVALSFAVYTFFVNVILSKMMKHSNPVTDASLNALFERCKKQMRVNWLKINIAKTIICLVDTS